MPRWVTFNAEDGAGLDALVVGEKPGEHLDLLVASGGDHGQGIQAGWNTVTSIGRGVGPVSWKPKESK